MTSINQEIARLLDKHVSIQKCMKRDIINMRSLARFLIEMYNLNYSVDAVISAIRRYDTSKISPIISQEAKQIFSLMSISTKDNIAKIVLRDKAFKEICEDHLGKNVLKNNCRIIKSKETITLIVSQKDLKDKLSLFNSADIISAQKDLAEIRLQFHRDITSQKGVIARIAMELASRDINIEEVIFSIPEFLVYVKEKNLVEAHQVLREIKR